MQELYKKLKEFGKVRLNRTMNKETTFRIGGPVFALIEVDDTEKLVKLLDFLRGENQEYFILGSGSNLLWKDDEYEGVVVKIKTKNLKVENNTIEVDAGVPLAQLVDIATQNELIGMEWGAGIPGTLGGAVRGNAGAFGGSVSDNLGIVRVYRDGEVIELNTEDCGFGYRESIFKQNTDVILSAKINLEKSDKQKILSQVQEYLKYRSGRFAPYPSAGSFFKNLPLSAWEKDKDVLPSKFLEINKIAAGWLVDEVKMRGFEVGGAKVSDEHANFIVNFNSSTQKDVLDLIEDIKVKVYNKYGIELEEEVEIVE